MKKHLLVFLLCFISLFSFACDKQPALLKSVSELVERVWEAESDAYIVKAQFGYCETPYQPDGAVGSVAYGLILKLTPKETVENAEYRASLQLGETPYEVTFALDPVRHKLTATVDRKSVV